MEVKVKPTERVIILGVDRRDVENLAWCAATYGVNRLFWVEGHLICLEVYERALELEMENGELYISQLCYAEMPKYVRLLEVGKGTEIPVVDMSDMELYRRLLKAALENPDD
jgi:hypothetical protein